MYWESGGRAGLEQMRSISALPSLAPGSTMARVAARDAVHAEEALLHPRNSHF